MSEQAKWYVVHTYSGYENKVADTIRKSVENRNLGELIHELRVPTELVQEFRDDNTVKEVERKLFPGYVLIKMHMTDESWYIVRNTRGVTSFVGPGSKPVALTDEEVAALGEEIVEVKLSYAVGDKVKIIDGAFDGLEATVEEIDTANQTVKVIVPGFGRGDTPVELSMGHVAALEK